MLRRCFRALRRILALPFQILGVVFFLGALVVGFRDVWAVVHNENAAAIRLGELWHDLSPETLQLAQPAVQRYLLPELWDPVILTLLLAPAWFGLAILAVLSLLVSKLIYRGR